MYKRKMQKIPYNLQNRLYFMDEMKEQGMFHCDLSRVYSVANTFEDIEEMIVK